MILLKSFDWKISEKERKVSIIGMLVIGVLATVALTWMFVVTAQKVGFWIACGMFACTVPIMALRYRFRLNRWYLRKQLSLLKSAMIRCDQASGEIAICCNGKEFSLKADDVQRLETNCRIPLPLFAFELHWLRLRDGKRIPLPVFENSAREYEAVFGPAF